MILVVPEVEVMIIIVTNGLRLYVGTQAQLWNSTFTQKISSSHGKLEKNFWNSICISAREYNVY